MSIVDRVSAFLSSLFEFEAPHLPAPAATREVVPDGWPPHYDRKTNAGGKYVVTVKCARTGRVASTVLPAWRTEEECRLDAWERHEYDPQPELVV